MKLFVVSDIHGHARLFQMALRKAGFDATNPEHLLIVCGDCFDRGQENREVFDYLCSIPRKVMVRGNHEDMLIKVLERGSLTYNNIRNGTDVTIEDFAHVYADGTFRISPYNKRKLTRFVDGMVDYFETANYVFVHGWLALKTVGETAEWTDDWRIAPKHEWAGSRWVEWQHAYPAGLVPDGKTLVCGHRRATYGCMFDPNRPKDSYAPFFGNGMIAIDACTAASYQVNVLVLEDDLLEPREHQMGLRAEMFDKMAAGRKRVEIRLWDEKRQAIRKGDTVRFTKEGTDEVLSVRVNAIYVYPDVDALLQDFTPAQLGFGGQKKPKIRQYIQSLYSTRLSENRIAALQLTPLP